MRKRALLVLVFVLLLVTLAFGCTPTPTPTPTPTATAPTPTATTPAAPLYNLRLANITTETSAIGRTSIKFVDLVQTRTNGRVKITQYWSQALGAQQEYQAMLQSGALDFGLAAASYDVSKYPIWGGLLNSPSFIMDGVAESDRVIKAMRAEFPELVDEYTKLGLKGIYTNHLPPNILVGNIPVRSLADMQGKKLRVQGKIAPALVKLVGGVPVTMVATEWYEAQQRGTYDANFVYLDLILAYKIYEVTKYVSACSVGAALGPAFWMSLKVFNSLPADIQGIIVQAGKEAEDYDAQIRVEAEAKALEAFIKAGVQIVDFPAAEMDKWLAMSPVSPVDTWIADNQTLLGATANKIGNRFKELTGGFKLDAPYLTPYLK